jgi:DtxR family Mn-dependent transcriptional regulator
MMAAPEQTDASPEQTDASTMEALTSESEEMYLITIAMAVEDGVESPVPVPRLAEALGVSRVSANEMVKKLNGRGLITYAPYKGVSLSPEGERVARTILRRRRLWSVFLSDQLGVTPRAADAVACQFEHVTPADVAQRLADFLGDPRVGPQGKPIPASLEHSPAQEPRIELGELPVGRTAEVVLISGDAISRSFLAEEGVAPGSEIELVALGDGGGCLVVTSRGRIHLSRDVAATVGVVARP